MTKEEIIERLSQSPFTPHPALRNPHAQTIVASIYPRSTVRLSRNSEPRYFDPSPGVRMLAHCSWQEDRSSRATLLMLHGLEGSTESAYMLGTAEKALGAGFNVIRLNNRNCGGTEHLTSTIYHAGLTEDLRQIITELIERDGVTEIYLIGFSLGGNVVLKLAGEYGRTIPQAIRGIVGVSPSIDLASCSAAIEMRSNFIYHMTFLTNLRSKLRRKARLFPDRYDTARLRGAWTIRKFDDAYVAPQCGFQGVDDYYARASALPFIRNITVPSLIIHAKDDPFIPFDPFERPEIAANPNVALLATDHGGHVGFISARAEGDDRFWAEATAVEFVKLLSRRNQELGFRI